jgi:hypothetical protein
MIIDPERTQVIAKLPPPTSKEIHAVLPRPDQFREKIRPQFLRNGQTPPKTDKKGHPISLGTH